MLVDLIVIVAIVAILVALATLVINWISPRLPSRKAIARVLATLTIVTLSLMVLGCGLVLKDGCPNDDQVCDAPGMAAAGITLLGFIMLAAVVIVGIPVANFVLKTVRRR